MRKASPEIERMMIALGCDIRSEIKLNLLDCDPEKQLLNSLKYYWINNSIFFLIYTSLVNMLYQYIHVDRLVKLAKSSHLTNDELCLLVAICDNLSSKDIRFKVATQKLRTEDLKMEYPPEKETDEFLIKRWGEEKSLRKLGAKVRSFYIEKSSKIQSLEKLLSNNPWIKYRALFGSNTRADAAYIILNSPKEITASEVSRLINCTRQTVGHHYKDLSVIRRENLGLKVA